MLALNKTQKRVLETSLHRKRELILERIERRTVNTGRLPMKKVGYLNARDAQLIKAIDRILGDV